VKNVVVVDAGMGNLASVERALRVSADAAGAAITLTRSGDPSTIRTSDIIVFPGQGAFRDCARALDGGLRDALVESIRLGKPYLGLCLGLQVLFVSSEESPDPASRGLALFDGVVRKMPAAPHVKIPHMGWNTVAPTRENPWLGGGGRV
jgi:glutamine amidotransferase